MKPERALLSHSLTLYNRNHIEREKNVLSGAPSAVPFTRLLRNYSVIVYTAY